MYEKVCFYIIICLFFIVFQPSISLSYENLYGPEYGETWVFYTDEDDIPHYVNISQTIENDTSRFFSEIQFHLFTRQNSDSEELKVDHGAIQSKYYNSNNSLKMLTHGWLSSGETEWIHRMKDYYLSTYDCNVIIIGWDDIARNPLYFISAYRTRYVGKETAKVLDALADAYNVSGDDVHLVGHSLGAHVMGFASQYSKLDIARITGLDPARPDFEFPIEMGPDSRLERSDARFVSAVHSCGGMLGYAGSHTHADYYPNAGTPPQPGCEGLQHMLEACSHGRSYEYFIESINTTVGFVSHECDSWEHYTAGHCQNNTRSLMGEHADPNTRGNFYLYTNSEPDYARG